MNRIASVAIGAAGIIHILLSPQHYAHAPAHGAFFMVAGIAELAWAFTFIKQPTKQVYYAGLVLAGGLIVLWVITRLIPAPFHDNPESIDVGGIVCKISELIGLGALLMVAAQGGILGLGKQTFARLFGVALLLSLAAGIVSYGAGRAAEPLFPSLWEAQIGDHHDGVEHGDHDHEEHDHENGEEHDHAE